MEIKEKAKAQQNEIQVSVIVHDRRTPPEESADTCDSTQGSRLMDLEGALDKTEKGELKRMRKEEEKENNLDEEGNLKDLVADDDSDYNSSEDEEFALSEDSDTRSTDEDVDSPPPKKKLKRKSEAEINLTCTNCNKEITGKVWFNYLVKKVFCNKACGSAWELMI